MAMPQDDGDGLPARRRFAAWVAPLAALLVSGAALGENAYTVPLFHAADNPSGQGFVRILNASGVAGTVSVTAWDDAGQRFGPLTLAIDAAAVRQFNSNDLEQGNTAKGLTGSTGPGVGDWRLALTTELHLIVLAFVRTADGFLTSIHDTVRGHWDAEQALHVYPALIVNPGSNTRQVSKVRVVNPNGEAQRVTVFGRADDGEAAAGTVEFDLDANAARGLSAQELETGLAAGLTGALGDGQGKWELHVHAGRPLIVMSLIQAATGHVTNLSTAPRPLAPASAEAFQARTAGKQVRAAGAGGYSVSFATERFTERLGAIERGGTYQYTAIGPRSALLQLRYGNGSHCAISVIFATQESGRLLSVCAGGTGLDIDWQLAEG